MKIDGPSKVDGPAESGWSWVKLDGLVTKSGRFWGKEVSLKLDEGERTHI